MNAVRLLTVVAREIENNAYANVWRENKEFYGFLKKGFSLLINFVSANSLVNAQKDKER